MGRSPTAWKALEKLVAETLGGIRIHRGGDFSESLPDVIAPTNWLFSEARLNHAIIVECKYRAKQPWIEAYKAQRKKYAKEIPIALKFKEDSIILLPLEILNMPEDSITYIIQNRKAPKYLKDACSQSKKYIDNLDIRDSVQLLYYKATKDRTRAPFANFSSMAVIGQKNDRLRLACFYQSEFKNLV